MSDSTPYRKFAGERVTPAPTPLASSGASTSEKLSAEGAGKDVSPFPIPANEPQRLAALRALDILDSPPETAYDEIAVLAAQICECPIGYISFVDDNRRWLKARYGLPSEVTERASRSHGLLDHDLRRRDVRGAGHDAGLSV